MKQFAITAFAACILIGCGGGGGSPGRTMPLGDSSSTSTSGQASKPVSLPSPSGTSGTPPSFANATVITDSPVQLQASGGSYIIDTGTKSNVTINANASAIEFFDNQQIGTLTINAAGTTFVFRPGVTADIINYSGNGNTIYLPQGMTLNGIMSGQGDTIIYYNP